MLPALASSVVAAVDSAALDEGFGMLLGAGVTEAAFSASVFGAGAIFPAEAGPLDAITEDGLPPTSDCPASDGRGHQSNPAVTRMTTAAAATISARTPLPGRRASIATGVVAVVAAAAGVAAVAAFGIAVV